MCLEVGAGAGYWRAARAFTYDGIYTSHPPGGLPGSRTPESL